MYPDNTDSVAQDQIRAFVDRILRMKEERRAIDVDIREIYAEAKGTGFDKTVLGKLVNYVEKRSTDANALLEGESLFDLYLGAYDSASGQSGTRVATHTHEADPDHDADGVVIEAAVTTPITSVSGQLVQKMHELVTTPTADGILPETAAQTVPALPVVRIVAERDAVESSAPIPYVLRPHCLHPELCAGQGRQHCYACTKAMSVSGVTA